MTGTIGINNKNPMNVKQPTIDPAGWWEGSIDRDHLGHAVFYDVVYSIRAAVRQLANYQVRDGKATLLAIFESYAPRSDGNDPDAYAKYVSKFVAVQPETRMLLFYGDGKVANWPFLVNILRGMLGMENFEGYGLAEETLRSGIAYYEHSFVK